MIRCPHCDFKHHVASAMARHLRTVHAYTVKQAVVEVARLIDRPTAPTASDTHAELAALRDEVRRLREAMSEALVIIDEQTPALTGWRAREMAERVRSALRGGDPSNP